MEAGTFSFKKTLNFPRTCLEIGGPKEPKVDECIAPSNPCNVST